MCVDCGWCEHFLYSCIIVFSFFFVFIYLYFCNFVCVYKYVFVKIPYVQIGGTYDTTEHALRRDLISSSKEPSLIRGD